MLLQHLSITVHEKCDSLATDPSILTEVLVIVLSSSKAAVVSTVNIKEVELLKRRRQS